MCIRCGCGRIGRSAVAAEMTAMAMMLRQAESYRSELRSGFGRRVLRHSAVAIGPGGQAYSRVRVR